MQKIRIVFDGPPGPEAGRFVEVETAEGKSIKFGEWEEGEDGFWYLNISCHHFSEMASDSEITKWDEVAKAIEDERDTWEKRANQLKDNYNKLFDDFGKLQADLTAAEDKVRELEGENKAWQRSAKRVDLLAAGHDPLTIELRSRAEKAEADNATLREQVERLKCGKLFADNDASTLRERLRVVEDALNNISTVYDACKNAAGIERTHTEGALWNSIEQAIKQAGEPVKGQGKGKGEDMKFKKKPVVIEAVQLLWSTWNEMCDHAGVGKLSDGKPEGTYVNPNNEAVSGSGDGRIALAIPTLEGVMIGVEGDWIIKGIKGELYPCKPDIFEATYEKVDEN